MKNNISLIPFCLLLLIPSFLIAQVPQGIPYQAVIRDNAGAPLVNTPILVRFTLHQNTTDGDIEYQETQSATTNAFGVINTQFGTGTPTQGSFAGIVWSNTSKFIQVEANDGNGYVDMGTQQMMSVPYAMYAGSAGNQSLPNGSTNGDMLYWDTNTESWISVPAGVNGQAMYFCDGVPTWGGCVPVLGNVSVSSITPYTAYAEFPMLSNGGSAPTGIGFYLSTQSNVDANNGIYYSGTWPGGGISNWINSNNASVPGGNGTVKSGNDGATSISNLTPNTQYYIVGNVSNAKGSSLTPVLSFSTPILVEGCMEGGACNYNPQANFNLGCYYAAFGYLCDGSCAGDIDQDGVCDAFDACSDINACNYNNPGNPGCAFDSDGDNVCDDQDGCLDLTACNWQINTPFISCQYAEMYKTCEGTCINDLDGDNVCDEIDNFICANDIDNDQVCDDIDQCTDVNACNYNQHWLDVLYNLPYDCRYDTDNDGICPVNPDHIQYLNYNIFGNSNYWEVYITQSGNQYQTMQYNYNDFDFCEDQNACNVSTNGYLYGTLLNTEWFTIDAGLLGSYNFDHWEYSYMSTSTPNSDYTFTSSPSYGCAYDNDNDGICDIIDHCHDINACNYMNTNNEECFPDTDNDGICDNLDGCFSTNFCSYNNPTATYCSVQNCFSPEYPNNAAIYDANCICHPLLPGCTDPNACNYNEYAMPDDGSCLIGGGPCDDGNENTITDYVHGGCYCEGVSTCANQNIAVSGCEGQNSVIYHERQYDVVEIGGDCWFAENLATATYNNGDLISGFFVNENDANYDDTYGKLYNLYTIQDSRGICPAGWHIPTDCEWMLLEASLGMPVIEQENLEFRGDNQGYALKSNSLWFDASNNSSGFSALPGGYYSTIFSGSGLDGAWWTSSYLSDVYSGPNFLYGPGYGFAYRMLQSGYPGIFRGLTENYQNYGLSVRCIKD